MTRDMTRKEFNAALCRRGWRKVLMWIDVGGGRSIGMVMVSPTRGALKFNRRASLARAIRESSKVAP